ncbi:hypothetical protein LA080_004104 [Diaporthe eres]|nr:hypothetical protein LA080_004104 [Diaporthe eres]
MCEPQPSRYRLLRLLRPRGERAGAGWLASQARSRKASTELFSRVRLQKRVTLPLAGNSHIDGDFSRGRMSGSRSGSVWPSTVGGCRWLTVVISTQDPEFGSIGLGWRARAASRVF